MSEDQPQQQSKLKVHMPSNPQQAIQTLKMGKETILFNNEPTQEQIKKEVQSLVTQTVQIGPVQSNQNIQQSQSQMSQA